MAGDSALQSQTLESVASAYNYHAWLRYLAMPHLGSHPLELGSGLGDYAQAYLEAGIPRITVSEADPVRLGMLRRRFESRPRVAVLQLDLRAAPEREHSSVVAFNVLEHIEDDVGALRAASGLVRPGGSVVMLVPAFALAMSDFDRRVGHYRRYTTKTLRAAFGQAGLAIDRLHYVNAPGLPAWIVGMRLLRMTPGDGRLLRVWDRLVIPAARRAESRWTPPFGQSVFAVGRVRSQPFDLA